VSLLRLLGVGVGAVATLVVGCVVKEELVPSRLCLRSVDSRHGAADPLPANGRRQWRVGRRDILDECDLPAPTWPSWRSSDTAVARVSDSGMVEGRRPGRATITARVRWAEVSRDVRVVAPVARITIAPRDTTFTVSDTLVPARGRAAPHAP